MKLPSKLWIGYRQFRMVYTKDLPSCDGCVSMGDRLIQIGVAQKPSDEVDTVIHEILHVLIAESTLVERSDQEALVSVLANKLTELFVRNPNLLLWIQELLKGKK